MVMENDAGVRADELTLPLSEKHSLSPGQMHSDCPGL